MGQSEGSEELESSVESDGKIKRHGSRNHRSDPVAWRMNVMTGGANRWREVVITPVAVEKLFFPKSAKTKLRQDDL